VLGRAEFIEAELAFAAYPLPLKLATTKGVVKQCLWLHRPSKESKKEESAKDKSHIS
jgi:hypothetical protein